MSDNVVAFPSALSPKDLEIGLAAVQPGAKPIVHKGVNDTHHGEVLLANDEVRLAYIKDIPARELANELLVAALGQALGLPMPRVFLALARDGVLQTSKAPKAPDGSAFVLASEDANAPSLKHFYNTSDRVVFEAILNKVVQWTDVDALYCVDTWCANTDRNIGNILVGGDECWMIDHGWCFSGPEWVASALDPAKAYENKISGWLSPRIEDTRKGKIINDAVGRVVLSDHLLDVAVSMSQARRFLNSSEQDAVTTFIKDRRSHLATITASALGLVA